VDGFIVLYRRYDDDDKNYERQTVIGSSTDHAMLRQLQSSTTYSIMIRSFNRHGESQLSNTVVMTTLASAGTQQHLGQCTFMTPSPDKSNSVIFSTSQCKQSFCDLDSVNVTGTVVPLGKHIKLLGNCVRCQSHF